MILFERLQLDSNKKSLTVFAIRDLLNSNYLMIHLKLYFLTNGCFFLQKLNEVLFTSFNYRIYEVFITLESLIHYNLHTEFIYSKLGSHISFDSLTILFR